VSERGHGQDQTAYPMKLAFRVSYLGYRFAGSQMQNDQRTVEGEFIAACQRLALFDDWRDAGFASAGRTDRGVHARSQIIAFSTDEPERAKKALNLHLPPDCWCTGWTEVPPDFHPRYAAKSRTYRYYFLDHFPQYSAMEEAAGLFTGTHNFSRFSRADERVPVRTILESRMVEDPPFSYLTITGESFLWNMVRCIATSLECAGKGELEVEKIKSLLSGENGVRIAAAPPEGLILWDVDCGLPLNPLKLNPKRKRSFQALIKEAMLMQKVLREVCVNDLFEF
ncbi:MAG: tRNA pseudouridine(38-40) synthase TruA, partial [Methanomicrobiaceae archaeon]|nr:tRNA pseudouridine(38-40) synthase TruA [Methanomicrobiaceae archaeon]